MMNKKTLLGFSLIELMISIVIGLLSIIFVMRTMIGFEGNRRTIVGTTSSLQNGAVAMFAIDNEISQSGWGINHPQVMGCNLTFSDLLGYKPVNIGTDIDPIIPLSPVVIKFSEKEGDSDIIGIYSSSSPAGSGELSLFNDIVVGDQSIDLNDSLGFGFKQNDVLLVSQNNGLCTMIEAMNNPVAMTIGLSKIARINIANARFTPKNGIGSNISNNVNKTLVFNLGNESTLSLHTWSVLNNRLMLSATNLQGSEKNAQPVVSNIVSIKALYGFDTTPEGAWNPDNGLVVTKWERGMFDANNNGTVGDLSDYQRIASIRFAIVARSSEPENKAINDCSQTTDAPTVFSEKIPFDVETIPISINLTNNGTIGWKCFKYQIFETTIPIKNSGWKPGI